MKSLILTCLAALFSLAVSACGGSGSTASSGHILAATTAMSNDSNMVLVVSAGTSGQSSRVCSGQITTNPYSLAATAFTDMPQNGNPCDSSTTSETVFPAGPQSVVFGIFAPGSQTPIKTTTVQVTVDGDVTATADGTLLSQ